MSKVNTRFYLPTLMISGYFDVRAIAARESDLTGIDFFERISTLIDIRIPDTLRQLEKRGLYDISDIITSFERIGCYTLSTQLYTCNKEREPVRALTDIILALNDFRSHILRFQNPPRSLVGSDPAYASTLKQTLGHILRALDKEEEHRKMRVLVVDDAAFMVKNISAILEKHYTIYALTKPTVVNTFLDHVVPDLFLLDYKMPEVTGFDLVKQIRARKEHSDTPIIFLTADGTLSTIGKAIDMGVCDYVVKPFKDDTLLNKIEKHIVRKKLF
ncbi:MAG: response regulator [Lachnospiraceae bacterium]|jgi:CheY-like chemotaxis protein|nr:response regulator [Lachnospiraceae bacterium]